jgi:hypothetical protein
MANRQIYQLDDGSYPSLDDVIAKQDESGSGEASKVNLRNTKIAMNGCFTYSAAITFTAGPAFNEVDLENDFESGTNFTYDNPSNGTITVTASNPVFASGLTFCVSGAINDAGTPYFLTGVRTSDTVCTFKILLHDGTGASTPFFTDVIFEIRVKLD